MPVNTDKYSQVIQYLASKLGGEIKGKKKLAKLLYYADFDYFERYEENLIGDTYRRLPMGPFPCGLEEAVSSMKVQGTLETVQLDTAPGYTPTEVYRLTKKPNTDKLNEHEIEILDRVISKYGHLSGTQLENLTHAEAPYLGTEEQGVIDYELAFYRGTDFNND